ncbi:MAG: hypothetical protein ACM31O_13895 [Bacteroidota bacterium]|jgi:hypothetical protein
MNVPPFFLAKSQFRMAVRTLPMWSLPVGLGAKRTVEAMVKVVVRFGVGIEREPPHPIHLA